MLRTIKTNKPDTDNLQRLWFCDPDNDLFIWLDNGQPVAFQFCYNKRKDEHALNWDTKRGLSHEKIDNGETHIVSYKMTPIMVPDGQVDQYQISQLFKDISQNIDPKLAEFVLQKLE